jgi:hypothetical protein
MNQARFAFRCAASLRALRADCFRHATFDAAPPSALPAWQDRQTGQIKPPQGQRPPALLPTPGLLWKA